jgi:dethiobiotin synthetase
MMQACEQPTTYLYGWYGVKHNDMKQSGSYFITATGTDIGKTFVTSLMLRHLRSIGRNAIALKPIMSGVGDRQHNDGASLLRAMGHDVTDATLRAISPWQFRTPLSPHRAAALEGQSIALCDVVNMCQKWMATYSQATHFIEGVGGVFVPLNQTDTVMDWMRALNLPIILVTGDYLGTLSHTLTALACLKVAEMDVRAVIVNQSPSSVEHEETIHSIRAFSPYNSPILSLRRCNESDNPLKDAHYIAQHQDFFSFVNQL